MNLAHRQGPEFFVLLDDAQRRLEEGHAGGRDFPAASDILRADPFAVPESPFVRCVLPLLPELVDRLFGIDLHHGFPKQHAGRFLSLRIGLDQKAQKRLAIVGVGDRVADDGNRLQPRQEGAKAAAVPRDEVIVF